MKEKNLKKSETARSILFWIFLTIGGVIMIFPFFWIISTALKPNYEVMTHPPMLLPRHPQLDCFVSLFTNDLFIRILFNSFYFAAASVVGVIFICSLAAFAFAVYEFHGRNIFFLLAISTMVIPIQTIMIPLFILLRNFHWIDTLHGAIIPMLPSTFSMFLIRQYMLTIPRELIDAARIDGCSEFGIYCKIMFPLSRPILVIVAITIFMWRWNELLWPLIVLNSTEKYTIQIFLQTSVGQYFTSYNSLMAGIAISIIPVMMIFLIFQRFIMESAFLSGLKE